MNDFSNLEAFAFETVIVPSANNTANFTKTVWNPSGLPVRAARVTIDPGPIVVYRLDGVSATSTSGHQAASFNVVEVFSFDAIKNFNCTSKSSGTATSLSVTYFR